MKKFIQKMLILLAPFIIVLFYSEVKLSTLENSYSFKKRSLEKQIEKTEILILGSSHIAYGLNPSYLAKKSFNVANVSQTLFYDKELFLKYIDSAENLETIIVGISYFSFWNNSHTSKEAWREYFYYRFNDIKHPELNLYKPEAFSYVMLYKPSIVASYLFKNFNVNLIGKDSENGWRKYPLGDADKINDFSGSHRVTLHHSNMNRTNLDANISHIEEILSVADKKKINVILVSPPVYETYSKFTDIRYIKENARLLNSLIKKYEVTYLDFTNDKRFVISDFYDNDHLNYKGAEKFTKILDESL